MATILQERRKQFLSLLADTLIPLGFKRRGDSYYRIQPYGKDIIDITFVSHPGFDYQATVHIGVRYDQIEDMVNAYFPDIPKPIAKWSTTIGNRLDNMTRQFLEWQWEITVDSDLESTVSNLMERAIYGIAIPFFERFSSLEEVLHVLSKWDDESHLLCMMLDSPKTGMKVIFAAYILNRPDIFNKMVTEFVPEYEERAKKGYSIYVYALPKFLDLVNDLRRRF